MLDRAVGYFLVRRARNRLTSAERIALARELSLVRQKRRAATRLLGHGERAEALLIARDAFAIAGAKGELIARENLRREVSTVSQELQGRDPPRLEETLEGTDLRLLERLLTVTRRVERELRDTALDESHARRLRVTRPLFAALGLGVFLWLIIGLMLPPRFVARASAFAEFGLAPENAIDSDLKTEWALPDKRAGFLDVIPTRLRTVQRVRLLNSKNLPATEHGAKDFRVEIFVDGNVITAVDGSFAAFTRTPEWKTIEFAPVERVQRVRITIHSWFGEGGGLTEVVVE